jgi:hypothetical protein
MNSMAREEGTTEAEKHCSRGHAEAGAAMSGAVGKPCYCTSLIVEGKEPIVIALTGVVGAGDDVESVANSLIIAKLWNKHFK